MVPAQAGHQLAGYCMQVTGRCCFRRGTKVAADDDCSVPQILSKFTEAIAEVEQARQGCTYVDGGLSRDDLWR